MKILSLGSLNNDHVYNVEHFVQPGETIASIDMRDFCGGKGLNQSIALARAGARAYHAGKVGTDGNILVDRLLADNVNIDCIYTENDAPTGHAIIQVDSKGQNCIIINGGANLAITEDNIDAILDNFDEGDMILLQNEISNLDYAITKAHDKNMLVALNPSPIDQKLSCSESLSYVDYLLLNEVEGFEITGEKDSLEICKSLHEKYPGCKIVLTLGKQGCIYYDGSVIATHGIYDVPVVDTTAAGDTFTGYFLTCITEGLSVERSLELASKASSLAVSRAGAADSIPSRQQVETTAIQLVV
jgi:Sugar kinases, ribokinase family